MKSSRWLKLGTMAALVVGLANVAAASSTPTSVTPTPTPTPTPVPQVRTLIRQGPFDSPNEKVGVCHLQPMPTGAGDLELIVDWTFADSSTSGSGIVSGTCVQDNVFNPDRATCTKLRAVGAGAAPKPRNGRRATMPRPAAYQMITGSFDGPHKESFSYQIFRTSPLAPARPGPACRPKSSACN